MFLVERFSCLVATLVMGKFGNEHPHKILCHLLSMCLDYAIYRICRCLDRDPKLPMALFATSHVALVYYVRPFSNSFESLILCLSIWCFCTLLENVSHHRFMTLMPTTADTITIIGNIANISFCTWESIGCWCIYSDHICFVWITYWCRIFV